jgi:class 3 adenylate cyclase
VYRSGRRAEALAVYQDSRQALVDELGIEPGRALRELHQRILNQDQRLDRELLPQHERPDADVGLAAPAREPDPLSAADDSLAAREMRKIVTVLCASVSAVTDGRVDPEALRRVLARALLAVKRPVERHGGSIESSAGGNVTGIFGVPAVHEDDALRALRAAAEIAEELQQAEGELGALQGIAVQHGIGVSTAR